VAHPLGFKGAGFDVRAYSTCGVFVSKVVLGACEKEAEIERVRYPPGNLPGRGRSLSYLTGPRYLSSQLSDSLIIAVRGTLCPVS
jgi:hypothetical protein